MVEPKSSEKTNLAKQDGLMIADEPVVIRRLPPGVEYTAIKDIVSGVPGPLTTILWTANNGGDPVWARFNARTYGAVERELRRQEQAVRGLPEDQRKTEEQRLEGLREALIQQLIEETAVVRRGEPARWISTKWTDPTWPSTPKTEGQPNYNAFVIEVWEARRGHVKLLDARTLMATPPPWGDPRVNWIDPRRFHEACLSVIRTYFRHLLRRPAGARWRTKREPAGWIVLTQYAIPALYDYLHRFYAVRGYRDRQDPGRRGHYAAALRRDILDILKLERPHVAAELTVEDVTSAIQRHLAHVASARPGGAV
jgi:hypothetical protein